MGRLLFSISLVVFGIGIGYLIQVLVKKEVLALPIEDTRKRLQKAALLFFNPVAILEETGIRVHLKALAGLVQFNKLFHYTELKQRLEEFL